MTRHLLISDEQLKLLAKCAGIAAPQLPPAEKEEADLLCRMIADTTGGTHDDAPDLLHGYTL